MINLKQSGLYFETRNDLIKEASKWLISNGYESVITLNCVSQLLKLESHSTLDIDMKKIVSSMGRSKEEIYSQTDEETFKTIKPLFEAEDGYKKSGPKTKRQCYGMFYAAKEKRELTGNLKIDIEHAIMYAIMYVEHGLGKDYETY